MQTTRFIIAGFVLAKILFLCCGPASAYESFITREQALAALFPDAEIKAETVFLTRAQMEEARTFSGVEVNSALIARYEILREGIEIARGYVDTHIVRTKKESLLIVLDAQGKVLRIEVTASYEPPDYRATEEFYRQYEGKILNEDLNIDRAIRPMAGATLTAKAANQSVRRILAIDRILENERDLP